MSTPARVSGTWHAGPIGATMLQSTATHCTDTMTQKPATTAALEKEAYAAFDRGCLADASSAFARLLAAEPDRRAFHYMQGLVHKYLLDWPTSLAHNLAAIALDDTVGEAEHWNAAIAATGLGDWQQARALW